MKKEKKMNSIRVAIRPCPGRLLSMKVENTGDMNSGMSRMITRFNSRVLESWREILVDYTFMENTPANQVKYKNRIDTLLEKYGFKIQSSSKEQDPARIEVVLTSTEDEDASKSAN